MKTALFILGLLLAAWSIIVAIREAHGRPRRNRKRGLVDERRFKVCATDRGIIRFRIEPM